MFNKDASFKGSRREAELLIVGAFRYAVGRHTTQSMWSFEDVILRNLDLLNDDFIRQFITEIKSEKSWERSAGEFNKRDHLDPWHRLQAHVKDYMGYVKDMDNKEAKRMYELLDLVLKQTEKFELPEYKGYCIGVESTAYLDNMLKTLEEEYKNRGYKVNNDEKLY